MLDIKLIRDHEDTVRQGLKARGASLEFLDAVVADDALRRKVVTEVETLKNQRNVVSKEIGMLKSKGQDTTATQKAMRELGDLIAQKDVEVRDLETAEIAVRAGLTGHLVFSTVHAASAAGVFARLMEMGLEPYLVASSVTAVVAQRLVRRVCEGCATSYQPPEHELREAGLNSADVTGWQFRRGGGCAQCGDSGYRGRTGIFELLPVTDDLRAAVMGRRPVQEIEALAAAGRLRLWQAGLRKVQEGITTLSEVMSVLGRPEG